MQKKNSKPKNTKCWYKDSRIYFIGLFLILTILMVVQLLIINILPLKYILPVIIILLVLCFILWWLQFGKRVNKINRILGKVLIVVFSLLLIVGNLYLNKAGNTIGKIAGVNEETDVISVIVMNDNKVEKIDDLSNGTFGSFESTDKENIDATLDDIKDKIGDNFIYQTYDSYDDEAKALYAGDINAMIMNEAYRGLLENNYPDFDSETKVIYTHEITKKVEDISKNVDVTNTSFNVYISGIDTYGPVSTKSRSDVNMIATVNPNTHQILLTSIPRDYYVAQTCQGNQKDKLTHTGIFGVDCTISTAEQFFGIDINYYVRVNFTSLISIVDALGGITVDNPVYFSTSSGYTFNQGSIYLDGQSALAFSRERYHVADGDKDRGKNQMRVLTGMINKAISPAIITNYNNILNAIGGSFQTNMDSGEITSLINMQLNDMSGWDIQQQAVNSYGDSLYSPANGFYSSMQVPDMDSVYAAINQIEAVLNAK